MWTDAIVEEVRRVRDEHAAQHGYDLKAIVRDLQRTQREDGRTVVRLEPHSPEEWASSDKVEEVAAA